VQANFVTCLLDSWFASHCTYGQWALSTCRLLRQFVTQHGADINSGHTLASFLNTLRVTANDHSLPHMEVLECLLELKVDVNAGYEDPYLSPGHCALAALKQAERWNTSTMLPIIERLLAEGAALPRQVNNLNFPPSTVPTMHAVGLYAGHFQDVDFFRRIVQLFQRHGTPVTDLFDDVAMGKALDCLEYCEMCVHLAEADWPEEIRAEVLRARRLRLDLGTEESTVKETEALATP
jgi:hypothetical protein